MVYILFNIVHNLGSLMMNKLQQIVTFLIVDTWIKILEHMSKLGLHSNHKFTLSANFVFCNEMTEGWLVLGIPWNVLRMYNCIEEWCSALLTITNSLLLTMKFITLCVTLSSIAYYLCIMFICMNKDACLPVLHFYD